MVAFKRASMVHDMFDMADSFMTVLGMTGSAGSASKDVALIDAVASAHMTRWWTRAFSPGCSFRAAAANYCTPEDRQWLHCQVHADMQYEPIEVQSLSREATGLDILALVPALRLRTVQFEHVGGNTTFTACGVVEICRVHCMHPT